MNRLKEWLRPLVRMQRRIAEVRKMETCDLHQERLIMHCPLNAAKRRNLAMHGINRSLLACTELARPHILHVGVTTRCNMRCPACPTGTGSLGRAGEDLNFDTYCRTVDSLRGSLMLMMLWDWGEPFLHPKLTDMVAYADQSDIRTIIATNGNVVLSPEKMEQFVRAKPSVVIICIDGADQETYESYRCGGTLETALKTIRDLVETRDRLGQSVPVVEFRTLATAGTENQMPDMLKLAEENGADLFSIKTLRPFNYRGESIDETMAPSSDMLSRYQYQGGERESGTREGLVSEGELICNKPLYAPTLNSDGVLAFCSYTQKEHECFGNLSNQPFDSAWKNPAARQRKREFLQRGGLDTCKTCYFRSHHKPTVICQVLLRPLPEGFDLEIAETPESFRSRF